MVCPFFSKAIHPSSASFSRRSTTSHGAQSRPQLTVIRYSPILSSSVGRAGLSSRGPVVLCRPPLLSTSLAAPPKLSQGRGHGSRRRPAATVRPRSGSHQIPQLAQQTHRTRAEGKAYSRRAQCPPFEVQRSRPSATERCRHHQREHQWHHEEILAVRTIHRRELERPQLELMRHRYCTYARLGKWKEAVRRCDKGTIMSFLCFICDDCQVMKTESLR
jgi:hypothetical protein